MKNVQWIIEKNCCSGCGACAVVCPTGCISIVEGLLVNYPSIRGDICINCGECMRVCPGNSFLDRFLTGTDLSENEDQVQCKIAYSKDEKIRYSSASGGFITGFLIFLLEHKYIDGAICVRQNQKSPLLNEVILAKTREAILESMGSRYSPSSNCIGLKELANCSGKYAFVGKPCDIEGVHNIQKIYAEFKSIVVLKIGLMCDCTPTRKGIYNLLRSLEVDKNSIVKIKFRGNGWPGFFYIELQDGKKYKLPYLEAWNKHLSKCRTTRCTICDDPLANKADITVGDPWGEEFSSEKSGASAIIIRNEYWNTIFSEAFKQGFIEARNVAFKDILRYQGRLLGRLTQKKISAIAYKKVFNFNVSFAEMKKTCGFSIKSYLKVLKKVQNFKRDKKVSHYR
ncbi:MAG: Coenzyme F420 hydrogenase/dehydrogenase, beta subunit C-terminal domain [Clostridiales bacterium]|nr:Coenzyme F420 hydrogenase/dehydrogenase, beta subunit C-terminal domain [Eubacteriales bacterium]MDH7566509.1 Coenzyme F420 hydrogenase/dehydrogenase, beta subunit C-terminal domain [Clostridiales bacterium]